MKVYFIATYWHVSMPKSLVRMTPVYRRSGRRKMKANCVASHFPICLPERLVRRTSVWGWIGRRLIQSPLFLVTPLSPFQRVWWGWSHFVREELEEIHERLPFCCSLACLLVSAVWGRSGRRHMKVSSVASHSQQESPRWRWVTARLAYAVRGLGW